MSHRRRLHALAIACAVVVAALCTLAVAGAAGEYDISTADNVTVPEQSIVYNGTSYEFTRVMRAEHGGGVTITTRAPVGEDYVVYLVEEGEAVASRGAVGNDTTTFDLSGMDPGTYAVATVPSSEASAAKPLVIGGYDVTTDVSVDGDATVTVSVSEAVSGVDDVESVNVSVWSDDETIYRTANEAGDDYVATVAADELEAGNYSAVALVRGPDEVYGRDEVLAVGDRTNFTVESGSEGGAGGTATATPNASTPTPTATPESGGGGTGGAATATPTVTDDESTPTASPTAVPGSTATATPTDASETDDADGDGDGSDSDGSDGDGAGSGGAGPTPTATGEDGDAPDTGTPTATVSPTDGSGGGTTPTESTGSGFGFLAALAAVLSALLWRRG